MDSPGQAVGLGAVVVIVLGALVWAMKYLLTTTIPSLQAAATKALDDERQRSSAALAEQRTALLALLAEQRKACEEGQSSLADMVREARRQSGEEHATLLALAKDHFTMLKEQVSVGLRELVGEIGDARALTQRPRRQPPEGPRGPQEQPPPGPQKRGPQT